MGNNKLRGKDLRKIKYTDNTAISLAIDITSKFYKHNTKQEKLNKLTDILDNPESYLDDKLFYLLAEELSDFVEEDVQEEINIPSEGKSFASFGKVLIEESAYDQMSQAMRLPVAMRGALMPDAHHGYGLPIGGVLATHNQVIPYAVGVDIGCRMSLTLYDIDARYLKKNSYSFVKSIKDNTNFGTGGVLDKSQSHPIIDRDEFSLIPILKNLRGKAAKQQVKHLAWLDLDDDLGKEYWAAMNFAGDYATACHDQIHKHVTSPLGIKPIAKIENHHNFAWKELYGKEELIVHRKGATPAAKSDYGIIPGSMTSAAFLVRGKGNESSLCSASHGAGRRLSRSKTKQSYTMSELRKTLKKEQITLMGGGVDEAPIAYKNITKVMSYQNDLVDVIGKFYPKIVRMDKP